MGASSNNTSVCWPHLEHVPFFTFALNSGPSETEEMALLLELREERTPAMPLKGELNQLSVRKGDLFKPLLACKSSERANGLLDAQVDLNMLSSSSASVDARFLLLPQYFSWASLELFIFVRLGFDSC